MYEWLHAGSYGDARNFQLGFVFVYVMRDNFRVHTSLYVKCSSLVYTYTMRSKYFSQKW